MQLNETWDFAFLDEEDPNLVDVSSVRFDDTMAVPGCFDATPRYAGRRGLAAYRTRAYLPEEGRYRLVLEGVQHWCRVFVNGEKMRDHVGGFTRFPVDFKGRRAEEAEIVVLVDNRFDYDRCPLHLEYFDWYHFGGIARPVELHRLTPGSRASPSPRRASNPAGSPSLSTMTLVLLRKGPTSPLPATAG